MGERIRKLFTVTPFKITVLVILIALTLFFVDVRFIKFMELKALDLRMVSRGALPSGGETVIVTVDEKSLNELGRGPWPRTTVAKVVERLKAGGAKVVGFDVVFAEPDENSSLKTLASLGSEMKRLGMNVPDKAIALATNEEAVAEHAIMSVSDAADLIIQLASL